MVTSRFAGAARIARAVALIAAAHIAVAVAATGAHAQDARPQPGSELKLSVAVGPAYALGTAADRWAKRITDRSGGRLRVKTFAGAALAQRDPGREFLALKDGAADLAVGSSLYWSAQVKELGVVGLPWLAAGPKRLAALVSGSVRDGLLAAMIRADVVPLALAPLGHRAIATVERALEAPADLVGLRVRVIAPHAVSVFYAALGAQPQTTSFAAAEAAFAAGRLDAQDGSPATFAATHLYSVGVTRVLLWDAIAEVAIFAVNRERWEAWTHADRVVVRNSAREVAAELAGLVQREEEAALSDLRRGGMTIARLTPAGHAAFAAAARGLYDQWAAVVGPELVRNAEAAVAAVTP